MLKDKVVIVTGAARGIGRAIAEKLAENGANLVLSDVAENVNDTAKEIAEKYGVKVEAVIGSVSKREDTEKTAEVAKELGGGKIWGLVNNAGITKDTTLKKMTDDKWDLVMDVNLKGTFLSTQAAIKNMTEGGSVVNISSLVGKVGNFGQTNYCASKAGVIGFTKATAKEYARKMIRCNAVLPGFIKTAMTDAIPEGPRNALLSSIPMNKPGMPEDIAKAVLFLLSDLSEYITGITLEVAGGFFM